MTEERSPRLLLVLPDLQHGGMQTRFLTLARVCERRGHRATVAAGPGPLEPRFGACADTVPPESVLEEAARHDVSVVSLDPSNVHLLGGLAAAGRLHVCIHNAPGTFDGWFRPSTLERLRPLLGAVHAAGRVSLSAASERQARFHEEDLGLPAGAIEAWPNGVETTGNGRVWSGAVRSVGVVTRLSVEKEPVVRAGAELVAAGRELGRDDAPEVVVAAGRASLEGLVSGRRVVAACWLRHPRGHVGPAVTAGNFTDIAALSFSWGRNEPLGAAEVWRDLEAMSDADVEAVRDLARASYSADAMYDRLTEIVAPTALGNGDPVALARGLAADARALESELDEVRAIADKLWVDVEWLRARAT